MQLQDWVSGAFKTVNMIIPLIIHTSISTLDMVWLYNFHYMMILDASSYGHWPHGKVLSGEGNPQFAQIWILKNFFILDYTHHDYESFWKNFLGQIWSWTILECTAPGAYLLYAHWAAHAFQLWFMSIFEFFMVLEYMVLDCKLKPIAKSKKSPTDSLHSNSWALSTFIAASTCTWYQILPQNDCM